MWNGVGEDDIPDNQKIAIVGVGCRYAAGVDTVEKLWDVLAEGKDCTSGHPESRYDVDFFQSPGEKLPGKMYTMRGGFLTQDTYTFDRKFFKMSEGKDLGIKFQMHHIIAWVSIRGRRGRGAQKNCDCSFQPLFDNFGPMSPDVSNPIDARPHTS